MTIDSMLLWTVPRFGWPSWLQPPPESDLAKAEVPAAGIATKFTDEELAANQDPKGKPKPKPVVVIPVPAAK